MNKNKFGNTKCRRCDHYFLKDSVVGKCPKCNNQRCENLEKMGFKHTHTRPDGAWIYTKFIIMKENH